MDEKYPTLTERLQSTFIDRLLVLLFMFILTTVLEQFEGIPDHLTILLLLVLIFGYELICLTLDFILDNYLKKIRVRDHLDLANCINIFQALIHNGVRLWLAWLSFLTINGNPNRRALHRLMVGGAMIKW